MLFRSDRLAPPASRTAHPPGSRTGPPAGCPPGPRAAQARRSQPAVASLARLPAATPHRPAPRRSRPALPAVNHGHRPSRAAVRSGAHSGQQRRGTFRGTHRHAGRARRRQLHHRLRQPAHRGRAAEAGKGTAGDPVGPGGSSWPQPAGRTHAPETEMPAHGQHRHRAGIFRGLDGPAASGQLCHGPRQHLQELGHGSRQRGRNLKRQIIHYEIGRASCRERV